MRSLFLAGAAGLLLIAVPTGFAQNEPKNLVEKSIKATGGAERLEKVKAYRVKGKGTIEVMGLNLEFTSNGLIDVSGRIRSELSFEFMGQKIAVIQVYDGKKGWLSAMGNVMELEGDLLKEMKEEMHAGRINTLLPLLKGNDYTLAPIGEAKVNGKPAQGVKVSAKGFRDVDLYFDSATGLVVKTVRQAFDTTTMKEVNQESVMSDFKEVDGFKHATKAVIHRDGKKFIEVEVTEYKTLEKVDDSEFAKP